VPVKNPAAAPGRAGSFQPHPITAKVVQDIPIILQALRNRGVDGQRGAQQLLSLFELPALGAYDSQHMQRIEVAIIRGKNTPVERFRLCHVPALMGCYGPFNRPHGKYSKSWRSDRWEKI
jgi:hypothetical protein